MLVDLTFEELNFLCQRTAGFFPDLWNKLDDARVTLVLASASEITLPGPDGEPNESVPMDQFSDLTEDFAQ